MGTVDPRHEPTLAPQQVTWPDMRSSEPSLRMQMVARYSPLISPASISSRLKRRASVPLLQR